MTRALALAALTFASLSAGLLAPAALAAQAQTAAKPTITKDAPADSSVAEQRGLWREYVGYIAAAADEWPEAEYDWKPVPTVRSFGQLVAHVAGAQYSMCAPALGEDRTADEQNVEKTATTKAAIVEALKQSTAYCERAYTIADAQAARPVNYYGRQRSALFVLSANSAHDAEHYGNVVTYMRLKGRVPPSSRGQ